jgi:hypothetical protein
MDGFEIVSPYKKGENTIIKLNNHFYCHFWTHDELVV